MIPNQDQPLSGERQLWQPDRDEQLAACEVLLASPLPYEARLVIRDLERKFVRKELS